MALGLGLDLAGLLSIFSRHQFALDLLAPPVALGLGLDLAGWLLVSGLDLGSLTPLPTPYSLRSLSEPLVDLGYQFFFFI